MSGLEGKEFDPDCTDYHEGEGGTFRPLRRSWGVGRGELTRLIKSFCRGSPFSKAHEIQRAIPKAAAAARPPMMLV